VEERPKMRGWNSGWGGLVIGQDKASTVSHRVPQIFRWKPLYFSHGARGSHTVPRAFDQPAPFLASISNSSASVRAFFCAVSKAIGLLAACAILVTIFASMMRSAGLVVALTDSSSPVGIYRTVSRPLARGALVEACLPDGIASYGLARGYLASGDCSNHTEPVLKIIGAMPGDQVDLATGAVQVNAISLRNSATLSCDSKGRELLSVARGSHRTAAHEVWLFGLNDARSWDSRYFGPVPIELVRGVLEPVLTVPKARVSD
jgi:conjugative transfer signal peptidase TraF